MLGVEFLKYMKTGEEKWVQYLSYLTLIAGKQLPWLSFPKLNMYLTDSTHLSSSFPIFPFLRYMLNPSFFVSWENAMKSNI